MRIRPSGLGGLIAVTPATVWKFLPSTYCPKGCRSVPQERQLSAAAVYGRRCALIVGVSYASVRERLAGGTAFRVFVRRPERRAVLKAECNAVPSRSAPSEGLPVLS